MRFREASVLLALGVLTGMVLLSGLPRAASPQPRILLVKDAHLDYSNSELAPYYRDALDANGLSYDEYKVSGNEDGPSYQCEDSGETCLEDYDIVIWFTGQDEGNEYPTLTSEDRSEITSYLQGGGKLFLTGQDIGFDIHSTEDQFYGSVLNASYEENILEDYDLVGEINSPIGSDGQVREVIDLNQTTQGEQSVIGNGTSARKTFLYKDKTCPSGDVLCFKSRGTNWKCDSQCSGQWEEVPDRPAGAISTDTGGPSGYKLVYFGFGFEGIDTSSKRETVMNRVFNYLRGPETKNGNRYVRSFDNSGWVKSNVSCDPDDDICIRPKDPLINATCQDHQLFSHTDGAEILVDGSKESEMEATDGMFDEKIEDINTTLDTTKPEGGYTLSVRCNDTDGYWGKFQNLTFEIDRTGPKIDEMTLEEGNNFTSKEKPKIEISIVRSPDYMRFSCNKTDWTSWREYSSTYNNFNITNSELGCNITDGNRTIYLQTRDRAGNVQTNPSYTNDWIVLDRKAPKPVSIKPNNNTYLNFSDNVTVNISSSLSPIDSAWFNSHVGEGNETFTPNISFDPGWDDEGKRTLDVWTNDSTGNLNHSTYVFYVDNTPPDTSDNSTSYEYLYGEDWHGSNVIIDLDVSDPWIGNLLNSWPGAGNDTTLYCINSSAEGGCTPSSVYDENSKITVSCPYGEVCVNYTVYHSNDTAGNWEDPKISNDISIDKANPNVSINEPSAGNFSQSVQINVTASDQNPGAGLDQVQFKLENASGDQTGWLTLTKEGGFWVGSYDTTNLADGKYNLTTNASDMVGNFNASQKVKVTVDNTPPTISLNLPQDNYNTSNQLPKFNFTPRDSLNSPLNCSLYLDGIQENSTSNIANDTLKTLRANLTDELDAHHNWWVNCTDSVQVADLNSTPNEGNSPTRRITIDTSAPQITITTPGEGEIVSGKIDLEAVIEDLVGVDKAWYDLRNSSNLSQTFDSGFLSKDADKWSATWDSSPNISGKEEVVFNVSANDSLSQLNSSIDVTFNVSNQLPSAKIEFPKEQWLNGNFSLDLRTEGVSGENISHPTFYNITNSTPSLVRTNSTSSPFNQPGFNFTDFIDISQSKWRDGNYTLNLTANQTNDQQKVRVSWFALDREAPNTSDNSTSSVNDTWFGRDQAVNLTCKDPQLPDGAAGAGCHKTQYCLNGTASQSPICGNPTTATPSPVVEVGCSSGETCEQRVVYRSNDSSRVPDQTTGNRENWNHSYWIRIDKEAPTTTDNFTSWRWFGRNVSIDLNATDPGNLSAEGSGLNLTLYCVDGSGTCDPDLLYNESEKIEIGCSEGEVCTNYTRYYSNDSLGNNESIQKSFNISIDRVEPSTGISPNGSNWTSQNVQFNLSCSDEGSGCNVTRYGVVPADQSCYASNLTDSGSSGWVNCSSGFHCREKVCFRSNDTVNKTEAVKESNVFEIDKKAPQTWNYQLNVSQDDGFGDRRIYPGDPVKFRVNLSDPRNVSYVEANLSKPSGYQKKVLSWEAGNETNGTWSFTYSSQKLGTYVIQNLTVNDSLGNKKIVNKSQISKNFTVVNGTLGVKLGSNSFINAGYAKTFNLTFDFNKTFSNPNLTLWVPPNSPRSLNLTPHYLNVSGYSCPEGCDVAAYRGNQSHPIKLNLSFTGNLTNFTLTATVKAETLVNDTNGTWILEWYGFDYKNRTKVKAPFLNVSKVICAGKQTCKVNQSQAFKLNLTVENVQDSGHSGIARNVELKASSSLGQNTSSLNNISSGVNQTASFNWNISSVGNYTFYFKAWEFTGQYNASRSKTMEVQDTEPPQLIDNYWAQDNLFNRNETVDYRVKASDNQQISDVWLELERGGYRENVSLNLSARYTEYDRWKLHYKNDTTGRYNITSVYINDNRDNLNHTTPTGNKSWFRVKKLNLSVSPKQESVMVNNDQVLRANVTGNASTVSSVSVSIQKPRNFFESVSLSFGDKEASILKFNGTYSNVTRSGNYTANVTVLLSSGTNLTRSTNFSVPYGNSSIQAENITLIKNTKKNVTWFIFPENGDLIGLNGTLRSGNESLVNLSSWENGTKSFGNVTWKKYNSSGLTATWEINVSNSTGETNLTLSLNSSLHSLGPERNKTVWITVIENDTLEPDIKRVSHSYSQLNLYQTNTIKVNATDADTSVDKVIVEMNYSQSGRVNLSTSLTAGGLYEVDFADTNETGNFSYRTYAWDVAGNVQNSSWYEFNVSDEYENVTVTHSPYNKGDNITFQVNVTDVRGQPVKNFNLTLKVNKNTTSNDTIVDNKIEDSGSIEIKPYDNPASDRIYSKNGTYKVYSTVVKNGNSGSSERKFIVSEDIDTSIVTPAGDDYYSPGSKVDIKVGLEYQDGRDLTGKGPSIIAQCGNCEKNYEKIEWNSTTGSYYDPSAFTAPDADYFDLFVFSVDEHDNRGYNSIKVSTSPLGGGVTEEEGGPGGGAGAGAAPLPEVSILGPQRNLPSNISQALLEVLTDKVGECEYSDHDFGYGNGTDFEQSNGTLHRTKVEVSAGQSYYFRIKCKVEGRVSEDSTAFSVKPKMIKKFKTEYERTVLVPRGENVTVWVDFINTGDKGLTVVPTARSECCDLSFAVREVEIRPGSRRSVRLGVHAPLSTQPRNYTSFLTFKSGKVERERIIELGVSEHLLTRKLSEINSSVPELRKDLKGLAEAGLDVSSLKEKLEEVQRLVKEGEEAIQSDDLEELRANVKEAQRKKNQIEGKIGELKFKQFLLENKWNILATILVFFFGSYLLTQLLIPWYSLRRTIGDLKEKKEDAVQTRKKAERQYFKRKIDEPTFRDIMTKEQDRILHLRGEVEKNERRLHSLVSRALSPRKILLFPINSARKLHQRLSEAKEKRGGLKEYLLSKGSTLREKLEQMGEMEIKAGAKIKSRVFRVPEGLARIFQKIKPRRERGKAVKEYGKEEKEFKRPEEEKVREFEEKVRPELKGIQKPEERVSKLTQLRRKIEKERSERDKKEEK